MARKVAALYFAALLHGRSNGLPWIRDRMVCGMDGEAKADKSMATMADAKSVSQAKRHIARIQVWFASEGASGQ
jgi:hypothetical protein